MQDPMRTSGTFGGRTAGLGACSSIQRECMAHSGNFSGISGRCNSTTVHKIGQQEADTRSASPAPSPDVQDQPSWGLVQELQAEVGRQAARARQLEDQLQDEQQASQRRMQGLRATNSALVQIVEEEAAKNLQLSETLAAVSKERDALLLKEKLASSQASCLFEGLQKSLGVAADKELQNCSLATRLEAAVRRAEAVKSELQDARGALCPLRRQLAAVEEKASDAQRLCKILGEDFRQQAGELEEAEVQRAADQATIQDLKAKVEVLEQPRQPAGLEMAAVKTRVTALTSAIDQTPPDSPISAVHITATAAEAVERARQSGNSQDCKASDQQSGLRAYKAAFENFPTLGKGMTSHFSTCAFASISSLEPTRHLSELQQHFGLVVA